MHARGRLRSRSYDRTALQFRLQLPLIPRPIASAPEPGHGGVRSSVIITVDQLEDVDALVRRAREAGATVTNEPADAEFFEGRNAYVADPESNHGEVAWSASETPVKVAARRAASIATDVQLG